MLNYNKTTFPTDIFNDIFGGLLASTVNTGFPPYNFIRYGDDHNLHGKNSYRLQFACAGYSKDELTVEFDNRDYTLTIKGEKKTEISSDAYLHHGIAFRDFTRVFNVSQSLKIGTIQYKDGLLDISFLPKKEEKDSIKVKLNIE